MAFLFYFHLMNWVCFNGRFLPAHTRVLPADNKSYRYGDGLFETMKVMQGRISLDALHFERLFSGLEILGYKIPPFLIPEKLQQEIQLLCKKNKCERLARVRLSVSRGNGGIYDDTDELQYLVECWPLTESSNRLNENGYLIDVFPDARKSCDVFSNLKSANYLPYIMAARYAKENKLNDCLVMNVHERIADASIANIFLIKNGKLITPALKEGCVNGVMRRYLLEEYKAEETIVTIDDVLAAGEVFLTNAINGLRWVKECRGRKYNHQMAPQIQDRLVKTIWR
jgi:branched-chain amino acid aminotransferase